jgi:hypothetical protein
MTSDPLIISSCSFNVELILPSFRLQKHFGHWGYVARLLTTDGNHMRMQIVFSIVTVAVLIFTPTTTIWAEGSAKSSHASSGTSNKGGSSKPVHLKAYTKKDGTHVAAHDRKAPSQRAAPSAASHAPRTPRTTTTTATPHSAVPHSSTDATRSANGKIARSEAAKQSFETQSGYPHGRPGYVVDHIKPLACGGADTPSNMQWQTIAEAKAKDKTERAGCR